MWLSSFAGSVCSSEQEWALSGTLVRGLIPSLCWLDLRFDFLNTSAVCGYQWTGGFRAMTYESGLCVLPTIFYGSIVLRISIRLDRVLRQIISLFLWLIGWKFVGWNEAICKQFVGEVSSRLGDQCRTTVSIKKAVFTPVLKRSWHVEVNECLPIFARIWSGLPPTGVKKWKIILHNQSYAPRIMHSWTRGLSVVRLQKNVI